MTTMFKPSRKGKRTLKEQAEMMCQAKITAVTSSVDAREFECPGLSQLSGNMDESMQLPQPTEESYSESESGDKDPGEHRLTVKIFRGFMKIGSLVLTEMTKRCWL